MIRLFAILFLLVPIFLEAQVDSVAHIFTYGGTSNDHAEELKSTSDNGYVVIGSTSSNSWGNTDAYLLKLDSNCNYLWSYALGGANNDWGYAIEETKDKGFIVAITSNSYGNGGYDGVLMKRDSLGKHEWTKVYGGNDWDFIYDVTETYDSGYVFCGETYNNSNGFSDVWIVKTNILGDTIWSQTIGGEFKDKANSIIETSDSNIVVAGIKTTNTDSTQIYVLKFSSAGVLLWDSIYGDEKYEDANNIIEINNGSYVVSGYTTSKSVAEDQDYFIFSTDELGNYLWDFFIVNAPLPTPDDENAYDIIQLPNNKLLVTGFSKTGGSSKNIIFFHLNAISGTWAGGSNVIGTDDDEYIKSLCLGNNGEIVGAGVSNSFGAGMEEVLIIKLDTIYNNQDTSVTSILDTIPLNVRSYQYTDTEFSISPNPAKDFISIKASKDIKECYLADANLKRIKINNLSKFDIRKYPSGVYFIELVFIDDSRALKKIIKY